MLTVAGEIAKYLPYLRRYARALTGAQERGDRYVRVCLEVLLKEPHRIALGRDVRLQLYSLCHQVWTPLAEAESVALTGDSAAQLRRSVDAKLESLAPAERQMPANVSRVSRRRKPLRSSTLRCLKLRFLARAWDCVHRQLATSFDHRRRNRSLRWMLPPGAELGHAI
jgi:hypothetical protein